MFTITLRAAADATKAAARSHLFTGPTEAGEAEAWLDEQEGGMMVLALVADSGPARAGDLSGKWTVG